MRHVPRSLPLFLAALHVEAGICGCRSKVPTKAPYRINHSPVIDSLVAFPDTIGPSDSTVVVCYARDPDGDPLRYEPPGLNRSRPL
jgi:hypothetical protein